MPAEQEGGHKPTGLPKKDKEKAENPLAVRWKAIRQESRDRAISLSQHIESASHNSSLTQEQKTSTWIRESCESATGLTQKYKNFLQDVSGDESLSSELLDIYSKDIVADHVDMAIDDGTVPGERREEFFGYLMKYYNADDYRELEKLNLERKNSEFADIPSEIFFNLPRKRYGHSRVIIKDLIEDTAVSDLSPLYTAVSQRLVSDEDKKIFSKTIAKAIDPKHEERPVYDRMGDPLFYDIFENNVANDIEQGTEKSSYAYNIAKWKAVKKSPRAVEIFGSAIKEEDEKVYKSALDTSLTLHWSQEAIDALAHFPTNDSIRNLIIITAVGYKNQGDEFCRYADKALCAIAKRSDWPQLLDSLEMQFPEIKSSRAYLHEWVQTNSKEKPREAFLHFRENLGNFTKSVMKQERAKMEQGNQMLLTRSSEASSNSALMEILVENGNINKEEMDVLINTQQVLGEYSGKKKKFDGHIISSEKMYSSLRKALEGEVILSEMHTPSMMRDENLISSSLNTIKEFIEISRAILDNSKNVSAVSFLSDQAVDQVGQVNAEKIRQFVNYSPALLQEGMKDLRSFVFSNQDQLLADRSDMEFLNNFVGSFGKRADNLIRGYHRCLTEKAISKDDRDMVFEFSKQFRVITPDIIKGYKQAKESGVEQAFIAHLKSLAEKMTAGGITDEERKNPYFKDLILHVYPNNSSNWTTYEKNASCSDRSGDLERYKIKPRYDIDLLSQGHIRIVEGATPDPQVQEEMSAPVYKIAEELSKSEYNPEKIKQELDKQLGARIKEIVEHGGLQGINPDSLNTPEERLFLVMTDSIYGSKSLSIESIKNLIITYEFANFEDVRDYIKGTNDRVSHAGNRDYALLCELGQFYSDRIKEVNRRLVEKAWDNPEITELMPEYFKKLSEDTLTSEKMDKINRLQVDKLGLNDSFAIQIGKMLEKRKRRKYTPEQVRELISRYESKTGGLQEKASSSENKQTKAIYGQLKSQREKTIKAIEEITGEKKDPSQFHLGEINLQQLLNAERNITEGIYDPDQFASYTAQRFIDIFETERERIDAELSKYESESGGKREVLYGYITKSKESANARAVGGVCVSGDNPAGNKENNMWDMPNFFQMVLTDPETLQCQGLVMLHSFIQGDQKILTASINPSSTYLYSVDEQALFKGIMTSLETFANENGFDMIALSQNKTIRTNRTGGQFEKAIDEKIASIDKPFNFDTPQRFSYSPDYQLQPMDTVWEKEATYRPSYQAHN